MKRISKQAADIAARHLEAVKTGVFDDPQINTREELIEALKQGKTFSGVVDQIETRFASVGSIMISGIMGHQSESYKKAIRKGFKTLIDN